MTETTKPQRELVNRLIDDLESRDWEVRDYDPEVDPFEPVSLSIDLVYTGEYPTEDDRDDSVKERNNVLSVLKDIETEFNEGVPIRRLVDDAVENTGLSEDEVFDTLNELNRDGQVYQPKAGFYRSI